MNEIGKVSSHTRILIDYCYHLFCIALQCANVGFSYFLKLILLNLDINMLDITRGNKRCQI